MYQVNKLLIVSGFILTFVVGLLFGVVLTNNQDKTLAREFESYSNLIAAGSKMPVATLAATETSFDPISAGEYGGYVTGLLSCGRDQATGNCTAVFGLPGGHTWSSSVSCNAGPNQIADCRQYGETCGCETVTFSATGGTGAGGGFVGTSKLPIGNLPNFLSKDPNIAR